MPGNTNLNFCLEDNIDFSGRSLTCYGGITNYYGTFDGNGFTLSNFSIYSVDGDANSVGLVNINRGTIRNLNFENCLINVNDVTNLGFIAGINYGEIINCSVVNCTINCEQQDDVEECRAIGLMTGVNDDGIVSNCLVYDSQNTNDYSIYAVSHFYEAGFGTCYLSVGGLTGKMYGGEINNCMVYGVKLYSVVLHEAAFMSVTPYQFVCGLAGYVYENIAYLNNCISIAEYGGEKYLITMDGNRNTDSDRKFYGGLAGWLGPVNFCNCYVGLPYGEEFVAGNVFVYIDGTHEFLGAEFSMQILPEAFASWQSNSEHIISPCYSVALCEYLSSKIWVWVVTVAILVLFLGVGICEYIFAVKYKRHVR